MLRKKELTSILINAIFAKMLLTYPRGIVLNSGSAAWIQVLYNFVVAFLIFFVTITAYRGKQNVIELAGIFGGKALRIIVGVIIFAVLIMNFVNIMRIFPETIKIVLLQDTQLEVIMAVFVIAIIIGAYTGIESIARIHYLFLPIAALVFVVFLAMLLQYYKLDNIMPILGNGAKSILVSGFNSISIFSDMLLLYVLIPNAQNLDEAKQSGYKAIIIGGGVSVILMLAYCLTHTYPVSSEFMLPIYQMARMIHLSSFFSRFEPFLQFVWTILILLYSSLYVYTISYVWQVTFNLKSGNPIIIPVALICHAAAMLPNSIINGVKMESVMSMLIYPPAFLIPLIFSFLSRRRK